MAIGHGQSIGGVQEWSHAFLVYFEDLGQHASHLLLAGGAIAGDGQFYLGGRILMYYQVALYGGGYSHALCPAQFYGTLYILAKEWALYG